MHTESEHAIPHEESRAATVVARARARRTQPVRVAIAGAGLMGRWHADAARRAGARVVGIADLSREAAQRLARQHTGARAYSSADEMLRDAEIDALHVCTPLSAHAAAAEQAIERGIDVLIEKPLTPQARETERLLDLAARRGVVICPVHQFIFQDGVREAKRRIDEIGALVHVESTFCSAGGEERAPEEMDEIVADILPHPLAMLQHLAPRLAAEARWDAARPGPGEMRAQCSAGGASASIFVSMHARPTICAMTLTGTDASIHIDMFHGFAVFEPGGVSRTRKILHPFDLSLRRLAAAAANMAARVLRSEPAYPGLRTLVRAFYAASDAQGGAPIPAADIIAVARARDAILAAAPSRKESS